MKCVPVKIYSNEREKGYKVGIGKREYLHFKKKKEAERFVRKFRQMTMATVRGVSDIQTSIYSSYRMYYYQLSEIDCHIIDEHLKTFNEIFTLIFKERSLGDFPLNHVENIFHYTFDIIDVLKAYANTHKEVALKHQMNAVCKNLDALYEVYKKERKSYKHENRYLNTPVIKLIKNELKKRA